MDKRYGFAEGFRFKNFAQWYDWQKDLLAKEILDNTDYVLSSKVELRLPGNGNGLTRHGGQGVCTLSREGLTYEGTKDGENVQLCFPMRQVYRLLFGAGENFEIYNGAEILYFVPNENDPDVGWCDRDAIYKDALELLEDPDLVKPIRCKDCLMWRAPTHEDIEDGITTGFCNNAGFGTESLDFCSDAIMR